MSYFTAKLKESELKPSPPKSGLTFGMGQLSAAKSIREPTIAPSTGFSFNLPPSTAPTTSGFSFAVGRSEPARTLDTVSEGAGTVLYLLLLGSASVAQADDQDVVGSTPTGSATFFHGY